MTPNNICNMALIKGLDIIAVTDHNSTRQLPAVHEAAVNCGIRLLYGTEIQTSEEVHVLGLFRKLEDSQTFQTWIDERMPGIKNDPAFFGNQLLMNGQFAGSNYAKYLAAQDLLGANNPTAINAQVGNNGNVSSLQQILRQLGY